MNGIKRIFLFLSLMVMGSLLHSAIEFIPSTPINESPSDNAIDIDRTPRFELSQFQATNSDAENVSANLVHIEWLVYPKSNVTLMGGFSTNEFIYLSDYAKQVSQEYPLKFNIEVNDKIANLAIIYPNGIIDLVNSEQKTSVIATIDAEFDTTAFNSSDEHFIKIKEYSDYVMVEWSLTDVGEEPKWSMALQAIIGKDILAIKFEDNNYALNFQDKIEVDSKIGVIISNEDSLFDIEELDSILKNNGIETLNFACQFSASSTRCNGVSTLSYPNVTHITVPQFNTYLSDSVLFNLSEIHKLDSLKEYEFQARYRASSNETNVIAKSNWSHKTSFTTRKPNVEYNVVLDETTPITQGSPNLLRLNFSNSGDEQAETTLIEVMFPFSTDQVLNSSGNFNFGGHVNNENTCRTSLASSETKVICRIDSAPLNTRIPVTIFYSSPIAGDIEVKYHACDPGYCGEVETHSRVISVTENENYNNTDNTNRTVSSSSSSGSGSINWVLLILFSLIMSKFQRIR